MKRIALILSLFIMLSAVFVFSGCGVFAPFTVDWIFKYYKIDGEVHHVGFDYYDHFNSILPDSVTISFAEDNTFTFKSYDGVEYYGTYKYTKWNNVCDIALTFSDGSEGSGMCKRLAFDGIWYEATFEIFGVTYYFDGTESYRDFDWSLNSVINTVYNFGKSDYKSDKDLYKAEVELRDGSYFVITEEEEYPLTDASYFCYIISDNKELKPSALLEGRCILRMSEYDTRIAIYYFENREFELKNATYHSISGDFDLKFSIIYDGYPNYISKSDSTQFGIVTYGCITEEVALRWWSNGEFVAEVINDYGKPLGKTLSGRYSFTEDLKINFKVQVDGIFGRLVGKSTIVVGEELGYEPVIDASERRDVSWVGSKTFWWDNRYMTLRIEFNVYNCYRGFGVGAISNQYADSAVDCVFYWLNGSFEIYSVSKDGAQGELLLSGTYTQSDEGICYLYLHVDRYSNELYFVTEQFDMPIFMSYLGELPDEPWYPI